MGVASFLSIFWKSNYQATIIFVLGCTIFENSFYKVVTITFSALVFTELLNIFTLVDRLNAWILGANAMSLLFYMVSVIFFRDLLGMTEVDWDAFKKIMIITFVCWAPFELFKQFTRYCCPNVSDKIMLTVRKKDRLIIGESGDTHSGLLTPPENDI
jgi:phospholipid-translocating ATPase